VPTRFRFCHAIALVGVLAQQPRERAAPKGGVAFRFLDVREYVQKRHTLPTLASRPSSPASTLRPKAASHFVSSSMTCTKPAAGNGESFKTTGIAVAAGATVQGFRQGGRRHSSDAEPGCAVDRKLFCGRTSAVGCLLQMPLSPTNASTWRQKRQKTVCCKRRKAPRVFRV